MVVNSNAKSDSVLRGGLTFVQQRLYHGFERRARTLTNHFVADASLPVNYVSRRQGRRGQLRAHFAAAEHDLITLWDVLLKVLHEISSIVIRNPNHAETTRVEIFLHAA